MNFEYILAILVKYLAYAIGIVMLFIVLIAMLKLLEILINFNL